MMRYNNYAIVKIIIRIISSIITGCSSINFGLYNLETRKIKWKGAFNWNILFVLANRLGLCMGGGNVEFYGKIFI